MAFLQSFARVASSRSLGQAPRRPKHPLGAPRYAALASCKRKARIRGPGFSSAGVRPLRPINEIRSLTGLRGVAALYVLLFHYFPLTLPASPFKRALSHGYLAVDLFFVLSGFVMALNYRHLFAAGWTKAAYATFLGRRIARIYPLYLVATLVGFGLVCLHALPFAPTMPRPAALFFNLFMVQSWGLTPSFDSPAWSISAEWAAYLVFPVLVIPATIRKAWVAPACAGLCIVMLAALCSLPPSLLPDYLIRDPLNMNGHWLALPVFRCLPEFTLGIVAFIASGTPQGRRFAANGLIAGTLVLLECGLLTVPKCDLAFVLLLPLLILSLTSEKHLPGRVLATPLAELIGTLSFSIYLTHKLFLGLLTWMVDRGGAAGIAHARSLGAAICLLLTLAISYAAFRFIEVPGRRWLRGLADRRRLRPFGGRAAAALDGVQPLEPISR